MATASNVSLADTLRQHRLLDAKQLAELPVLQNRFPEPKALAKELIQRGWLTPYQANQLLQGKGQELILGSYILLERLGEGGMGLIFKARHRNLNRISAIKLIRKERLDNPDAARRFQREIQAVAALSHPNIVGAFDADQIGGTHLLVMEYIEGAIDLARVVKKNGPLPVEQACEYIRQAALGLQHAYERGLVHRDIKPANLLLTTGGKVVKVLDMGLARLDQATAAGNHSGTLTMEGSVMGTPDYIAPEQALDSHTVDIRADLYSLGCTFYFLLCGQVPFPDGSPMEKLIKHQIQQPEPIEHLRREVPPDVAEVVRKLMAKKPIDRYQTPAEVAAALAPWWSLDSAGPAPPHESAAPAPPTSPAVATATASRDTLVSAFSYMDQRDNRLIQEAPARPGRPPGMRWWVLLSVIIGAGFLISMPIVLFVFFKFLSEKRRPVPEEIAPAGLVAPTKKTTSVPPNVAILPVKTTTSTAAIQDRDQVGKLLNGLFRVEGRLTKADLMDRVRVNSFHKVHPVKLAAKKLYTIDLVSKDFDSYLRLEDANGTQLAMDDDSGGYPNARIHFLAPRDDTYRIIATTFNGGAGNYTLTVRESTPWLEKTSKNP